MRVLAALLVLATVSGLTQAQTSSTGLVVGSGNFFSPIVRDLDKAVEFYRDGLGLDVQGDPGKAESGSALLDMFGLPDAQIQWSIARTEAASGGVEIVEIAEAGGESLQRQMQDPGAFTLIVFVRDFDATFARLKALGAPVVSTGGAPVDVPFGEGSIPIVVVTDPDGHFVELVPADDSQKEAFSGNVVDVRVRLTVADAEESMGLFRDVFGLKVLSAPQWSDNNDVAKAFGMDGAQYRAGIMQVPSSELVFEVIDFKDVERQTIRGGIQDPGSTRIQFLISDVDAAVAAIEAIGGEVVSSGGEPLELPVPGSSIKVAIAREPNNLFMVLIESAAE